MNLKKVCCLFEGLNTNPASDPIIWTLILILILILIVIQTLSLLNLILIPMLIPIPPPLPVLILILHLYLHLNLILMILITSQIIILFLILILILVDCCLNEMTLYFGSTPGGFTALLKLSIAVNPQDMLGFFCLLFQKQI